MKITVCVVTYNQEKYIRKCLDSIVNQDVNQEYQVVICDDASTDGTSAICQEFAERYNNFVYIRHKNNIGSSDNFKFAHSQALTDYVAHCDGDDYWHLNKLKKQVDFLEKNVDCVAVYSNAVVIGEDGIEIGCFNNGSDIRKKINIEYLLQEPNFLNNSSMVYRKSAIGNIFKTSGPLIDYKVHIELAKNGLLGYINEMLVYYRYGATGSLVTNSRHFIVKLVSDARLYGIDNSHIGTIVASKIKSEIWSFYIIGKLKTDKVIYQIRNEAYCSIEPKLYNHNKIFAFYFLVQRVFAKGLIRFTNGFLNDKIPKVFYYRYK